MKNTMKKFTFAVIYPDNYRETFSVVSETQKQAEQVLLDSLMEGDGQILHTRAYDVYLITSDDNLQLLHSYTQS